MLKAYDLSVKNLIEVFTNNIPVIGLRNDDSSDNSESVNSQTGLSHPEEISTFPVISVFRGPDIKVVDGSSTKRPSTYLGYVENTIKGPAYLVSMRCDLPYTIDVFDTTRASAEKIAMQLFFRLRNNPQVEVNFNFKDFDYSVSSIADIQMGEEITNTRVNDSSKAQVYKIRMGFTLVNANIYDLLGKEPIKEIRYKVDVNLDDSSEIISEEGPPNFKIINNNIKI